MKQPAAAAAALLLLAGWAQAQPAVPAPSPRPKAKASAKPSKAPTLDFTGAWVLDEKASRGVSEAMKGAVLKVRQNGNRIWIEPLENPGMKILAEEIVVDGRKYEKAMGGGRKGTLEAAWGKDATSLWLQVIVGNDENPAAGTQRMIWRLRDGGRVWTRQTRTIQPDGVKDTFLVFRKRE